MPGPCWPGWKSAVPEARLPDTGVQLSPEELDLVRRILAQHVPDRTVHVFGSRARGQAKAYSDLDLAIMGDTPVPASTLGTLRDAFADSALPWRVDVVDWADTSPEFRTHIRAHSRPLPGQ